MIEIILLFFLIALSSYMAIRFFAIRKEPQFAAINAISSRYAKPASLLAQQLATLNLNIQPVVFVIGMCAVASMVFMLFISLFPQALSFAGIAALATMLIAFFTLNDIAAWRMRKFETQLLEAIELLHTVLQSGETPATALKITANASRGLVKKELTELLNRIDYGLSIDVASARLLNLYNLETVRLFVQALRAKWQTGGDFEAFIGAVARIARERLSQRSEIAGKLSGGRYAAIYSAAIPYALVPFFIWQEPRWLQSLAAHPEGATYVLIAVLCQIFGFLWLRKILRVAS